MRERLSKLPQILRSLAFVVAAAGVGLGASAVYDLAAGGDCCAPGAACCTPGSPCCHGHHGGSVADAR